MYKKTLIIIANIFFLILLIIGIFIYFTKRNETPTETTTTPEIPVAPSEPNQPTIPKTVATTTTEQGVVFNIKTTNGDIGVINFYNSPQTQVFGTEKRTRYAVLKEHPYFSILYIDLDQSFLISIQGQDIRKSREDGEEELLQILGITKDDACKLLVAVTVPNKVSRNAFGVDYGLSWCPNGKPMPVNAGPWGY